MDDLSTRPPANRQEFWARFFWGAAFGIFAGLFLYLSAGTRLPLAYGWLLVPASGALFGVVAGWFGDRFWRILAYLLGH